MTHLIGGGDSYHYNSQEIRRRGEIDIIRFDTIMISFERLKQWSRGFLLWLRVSLIPTSREIRLIGQPHRVEQVFLVDKISGILECHLAADETLRAEAAPRSLLVAAMLSAIRAFVGDNYSQGRGGELNRMTVGDLDVCMETGAHFVLATVVRGAPPQWLQPRMKAALAEIEGAFSDSDDQFDADREFSRIETRKTVLARCFKE